MQGKNPKDKKPVPPPPNNNQLTDDVRLVTGDLKSQVESMAKLQSDMSEYLQSLSSNYRVMVEEI